MKHFDVQMIDNSISSQWWKTIVKHFIKVGDAFEIRCWREEVTEIEEASLYGIAVDDKYEVSIKGFLTKELLTPWKPVGPALSFSCPAFPKTHPKNFQLAKQDTPYHIIIKGCVD